MAEHRYFKNSNEYDFVKHNKWKMAHLQKYKNKKVLDIGSGDGRFLKLFPNWLGIDVDDLAQINERVKKAGITDIPYPDNSFDAVIVSHVLEHIPRSDVDKAMKEVKRVLKDKGEALIYIPVPGNLFFYDTHTHLLPLSKTGLVNLFDEYGLKCIASGYSFMRHLPSFLERFIIIFFPNLLTECWGVFKNKESEKLQ